ncbi:hypothetical protein KKC97_05015, partial [bacterium]|nr:hypothetical protein [bacterium]
MIHRTCLPVLILLSLLQTTVNAQPDSVWARIFDVGGWDECSDVIPLSDGGFALVGHTLGEEALQEQIYVMTTDSGGNPNQAMSYGGGFMDMGSTLLQQNDGSLLVAGWSHISNETEQNIRLIGVGLDLQAGWAQSFGGSSQERCYS